MMRHISEIIGTQLHGLTVRARQGQNASHGFSGPKLRRTKAAPTLNAAFLCQSHGDSHNGRVVWEGATLAGPKPGLLTRTAPPTRLAAGKRYNNRKLRSPIMANATTKGAIRPKTAQTRIHADGSTDTITWVREATCIKRLRRFLAKTGCTLHITREGSADRQRHGEYYVRDQDGRLVDDKINLEAWLRSYDLLADDERIDPPLNRGWLYYIGRYERVIVDGIEANYAKPITRTYTTEAAARKAVEHLTEREGLVICGYDATVSARYAGASESEGGSHD